ncbi:peptidoglycan editing factor PgeF [Cellulomonas persica]|uniref:Purine nucleoside phosphorylase n=1 Tax=Cellulomonas persica TaxID=76861 RepID=A0A510V1D7_9CELL|nr:peptidoglycan editing factor PgeF [Cellulomonas persica]GEK19130.1 laccase domain protein [Cellulomonas persica]
MTSRTGAEIQLDEVDLGPGVVAGFTDRRGGVSAIPYASLNLGAHVGDDPRAVATNRDRLATHLAVRVAFADQVHGTHVVEVAGADALPDDVLAPVGTGDALVTSADDVALGVLVADCVPVLLADPEARVVAVAHAGRRGLLDGVVQAALDAMVARGAVAGRVRAAIGPAVAGASYEVPTALRDEVAAVVPATAATTAWGTPALDLPAGVEAVLRSAGVSHVVRSVRDTRDEEDLFSYRREQRTGRFAGVVRLV